MRDDVRHELAHVLALAAQLVQLGQRHFLVLERAVRALHPRVEGVQLIATNS